MVKTAMYKIFIMRHGEAEAMKADDFNRCLTENGFNEADEMAANLSLWTPSIDALVVSPYLRAQQTAQQIKRRHTEIKFEETSADFTPESCAQFAADYLLALVHMHPECKTWLVISHMPLVSYLVDQLCCGKMPIFNTAAIAEIHLDEGRLSGSLVGISSPKTSLS